MTKARDLANAGTALTSVSATELGYLDGVTSAVQTQINSKIGQATAINPTVVDAKGDIIAATAADTVARLAVGANNTVLTADSSTATGLKWASPSASTTTFSQLATGSLSGGVVTVTGLSGYNILVILLTGMALNDNSYSAGWYLNSDTSSKYTKVGNAQRNNTTYETSDAGGTSGGFPLFQWNYGSTGAAYIRIDAANSTGIKQIQMNSTSNSTRIAYPFLQGFYSGTSVISSINFDGSSSSWQGGTYTIYGAN